MFVILLAFFLPCHNVVRFVLFFFSHTARQFVFLPFVPEANPWKFVFAFLFLFSHCFTAWLLLLHRTHSAYRFARDVVCIPFYSLT